MMGRRRTLEVQLLPVLLLAFGLAVLLALAVAAQPTAPPVTARLVAAHRPAGLGPVTAVLLDFRGYDTLLEVMVLFLALVGIWAVAVLPAPAKAVPAPGAVMARAAGILVPMSLVFGAYLVWRGSSGAGGAFQGGAILGGGGVLLFLLELDWPGRLRAGLVRAGVVAGPAFFLAVAVACQRRGDLLQYPPGWTAVLVAAVEAVCGLSIGLTLAGYFIGGRPAGEGRG